MRGSATLQGANGIGKAKESTIAIRTWDGSTNDNSLIDANWSGNPAPVSTDIATQDNGGLGNRPTLYAGDTVLLDAWQVSAGVLTLNGSLTTRPFGTTVSGVGTINIVRGGAAKGRCAKTRARSPQAPMATSLTLSLSAAGR